MFLERFAHFTSVQPEKVLFRFLGDSGKELLSLSYKEVNTRTQALAQSLLGAHGCVPGQPVLLVFLPSLDFILAFIACLRAGLLAVPVYPPDPRNLSKSMSAFTVIQAASGATVALTHTSYNSLTRAAAFKSALTGGRAKWPVNMTWLVIDELMSPSSSSTAAIPPHPPSTALAFLQYTSGSTSTPKGVMVSHGNLSHNLATIVSSLRAGTDTQVVSWLPQYHDMGLIGSYLGVIQCGGSGVYMSPISFVKSPVMWVEAMSKYKATHVQSPNFGYKLCARKFVEKYGHPNVTLGGGVPYGGPTLDLSSLQHMFNAAEPITTSSIALFFQVFAPFGLDVHSMMPGYGLAEHTVYVSDGGPLIRFVNKFALEATSRAIDVCDPMPLPELLKQSSGDWLVSHTGPVPVPSIELVSCGAVTKNPDIHILIVDPSTLSPVSSEDCVGEIWIRSPSVTGGYWNLPDGTAAAFGVQITVEALPSSDPPPPAVPSAEAVVAGEGFLRTGDLGVILDGQLFVTGRIKDMIIIRGRNHYPQDIEATVERDERVRPGCSACFAVPVNAAGIPVVPTPTTATSADVISEEEGLVCVAEVRNEKMTDAELTELSLAIRRGVQSDHGVSVVGVLLLKPHAARKTTSGKIARKHNLKAYMERFNADDSPWAPKLRAVLFDWTASPSDAVVAIDEAAASSEPAQSTVASGLASAIAAAPVARHAVIDTLNITPPQLTTELIQELARVLEQDTASIDPFTGFVLLGMDSMKMHSLSGVLQHRFSLHISQEQLFNPETCIAWVVTNRVPLTQQKVNDDGTVVPPSVPFAPTVTAPGVLGAGAPRQQNMSGRVARAKEPSFCQRNCPCCPCCY